MLGRCIFSVCKTNGDALWLVYAHAHAHTHRTSLIMVSVPYVAVGRTLPWENYMFIEVGKSPVPESQK